MEIVKLVEAAADQPIVSLVIAIMALGSPTLRTRMRTLAGDVRCVCEWFRDLPDRAYHRTPRNFWGDAWAGWWLFACPMLLLSLGTLAFIVLLAGGAQSLPMFACLAFLGFAIGFIVRFMWATILFVRGG